MILRMVLTSMIFFSAATLSNAEPRIALIIGNGNYTQVAPLRNPVNDAKLISSSLTGVGFEVTEVIDATQIEMKRAIAQFGRDLRLAGPDATGLFFYAGHAVQSMSTNFLLPVDITVQDEADFDILGVQADWVLKQMFSARNKTNIVILDACRNNPFEALTGVLDDGLAEMNAPTGTFLSYATAPGGVAADGLGANSPFTKAVNRVIPKPGVLIEQAFKQVRVEVLNATGGLQTPWDASSLTDDFSFVQVQQMSADEVAASQLWDSVQSTSDPVQLMLFLRAYPDSIYADEARALLKTVMAEELKTNDAPAVVEAPKPAPAPGPSAEELAMIEAAQVSGAAVDYQTYLDTYPAGAFTDLAMIEMEAALAKEAAVADVDTEADQAPAEPDANVASRAVDIVGSGPVRFDTPLVQGSEAIVGRTIKELITGSPLYPPIEGLPDEVWKGKGCSNCHQWEQTNLCAQAERYLSLNAQRSLSKEHPYGGAFKQTLRAWAASGCN